MVASVKFSADGKPVEQALDTQEKKSNQVAASLKRVNKEAREVNRIVQRGARLNESATERWTRQNKLLEKSFKSGRISEQEMLDGLSEINRELEDSEKSTERFSTAVLKIGGASAFALGSISKLFTVANQEAKDAADSVRESVLALSELAQVAKSLEDNRFLESGALEILAAGAADNLSDAGRASFKIRSAGLDADRKQLIEFGSSGLVADIGGLATSLSQIVKGFGAAEAGDTGRITAKTLAASGVSPDNINEILAATAKTAQASNRINLRDEEALGLVSFLSGTIGSSAAATQATSLFKSLEKANLTQGTLVERVQRISEKLGTGDQVTKNLFGADVKGLALSDIIGDRQEASAAFGAVLNGMKAFEENLRNIDAAEKDSKAFLEQRAGFALQSVLTGPALLRRQGEGALAAAKAQRSGKENLRLAILDQLEALQLDLDEPIPGRFFTRQIRGLGGRIGAGVVGTRESDPILRDLERRANGDPEILKRLDEIVRLGQEFQRARGFRTQTPTVIRPENE